MPSPVLRTSINASFDTGRTSIPSAVPIPVPVPVAVPTSVPTVTPQQGVGVDPMATTANMFHNYRIDDQNGTPNNSSDNTTSSSAAETSER